jgi:hypothetical protein
VALLLGYLQFKVATASDFDADFPWTAETSLSIDCAEVSADCSR